MTLDDLKPVGEAAPAPNRPDEHWWIRTDEGMPLEPACVTFEGDTPAKVQLIGDDSWGGKPVEDFQWSHTDEDGTTTVHSSLELVERIPPPGHAADIETLWQELRSATDTIARQGEILTEVVNALKGPPPEGTQWSHDDAGELARKAKRKLERTLRDVEISYAMEQGDDDTVDRLTRQAIEALEA
ncbi:hypothetical protein [Methylobacterium sp. WL64]|uniref:hypothetical protein n=1 Tax=Methylobacterium sp. WL64 TaxID=2603894 RepID=UPI0011CA5D6C|nr:hypothetical protein [Methylobacterium sp. WL64]